MPKHIQGIDHVVILAADLDRAAETYTRLGFTLSPRGVHSDHMGSANHTIMLQDDYFEVLSVLKSTPSQYGMAHTAGNRRGAVGDRLEDR